MENVQNKNEPRNKGVRKNGGNLYCKHHSRLRHILFTDIALEQRNPSDKALVNPFISSMSNCCQKEDLFLAHN